ncbi:uncharacterized protein [Littorina saxatilis]|uniref:Uncharacterized protein n=1 Tax=Littorina saxatilis TaxID=31220 RepID=A0AAN9B5B9_9CAEN
MSSFVLSRSALKIGRLSQITGALVSRPQTVQKFSSDTKLRSLCLPSNATFQRCHWCLHNHARGSQTTRHCTKFSTKLKPPNQMNYISTSAARLVRQSECRHSSRSGRKSASITSTAATEAQALPHRQTSHLHQRFIYVQTSTNRWEDIPGGVIFDVAYLDSAPGEKINPSVPLVVSLHSTPGSFYDLQPILESFVKAGCRVLAPSFPGHGYTEGVTKGYSDVFMHSTSEKAEFVRDFLANLGVEKVDLLIGQGCGCYPAMRLTAGIDTTNMFRSVAFLSPWPHRSFRAMRQKNLIPLLHDMWERPYYRTMAKAMSRLLSNTHNASTQERITLVYTLYHANFGEIGGLTVALDAQNVPRVMFFSEDDQFVESDASYELADLMGIGEDRTHRFTGQLEKGTEEQFPSCFVFDKGGQHLEDTQPGVITAVLLKLLSKVRPGFSPF